MKSFSTETLNFFFRKRRVSNIFDLAKTVWALRVLSRKSTRNFEIKERWALYLTNLLIVANKRVKYLLRYVAHADPYSIKVNLLDQTDHDYKKYGGKCDSCNNFVLEKTSFVCFTRETKFKIRRDSTLIRKMLYT